MSLISLINLSLVLANNTILDQVNWQLHPKERIALVGRNGAGKSTLLKLLQGTLIPDHGTLKKQQGLRIASLIQDVPTCSNETVLHYLTDACQQQIDRLDTWDVLPQIHAMADRLGLPLETPVNTLSGGMRRRVLLCAALLAEADVLLLDEPTNHLDIKTIEWLENYLKHYSGTVLFVTHDRTFLTNTATSILEIDRGMLHHDTCDYETYLDRQEARRITEQTHQNLFDKRLKEEEAWLRQGVKARRTRNEGRVRDLEAMRSAYRARREQTGRATAEALQVSSSGKQVLVAEHVSYSPNQQPLIHDFSCLLMRGDKIGILGPNGSGKTTLTRLLLGETSPTEGHIQRGTNLNIAYFDQLRHQLDEQQTVMQNVADGADFVTINGQHKHVASYLRDFLFSPERFNQPVFSLSGGERNRLLLAKLFAKPINLLVMDEPTNDLDIETLELLESMLEAYTGTLLLISHDRAFINHLVSSIWVFEADGHIAEFVGGYDDYCRHQKEHAPPTPKKIKQHKPTQSTPTLNAEEKRELKRLPRTIEQLEARIDAMHLEMGQPGFYNQPPNTVTAFTDELATHENKLTESYARWEVLESR
jgi:ABC transport system ATP-binding/permease protein